MASVAESSRVLREVAQDYFSRVLKPALAAVLDMDAEPIAAIVRGSAAYGFSDAHSDLDLCVVVPAQNQELASRVRSVLDSTCAPECRAAPLRLELLEIEDTASVNWHSQPYEGYFFDMQHAVVLADPTRWFSRYQESVHPRNCPDRLWESWTEGEFLWLEHAVDNMENAVRRGDTLTAAIALGEAIHSALALAHWRSRRFIPPHKWLHASARLLGAPWTGLCQELTALASAQEWQERVQSSRQILVSLREAAGPTRGECR